MKKKTRRRRKNLRGFSMISNQSFNKNRKSCRSEPNHLPKCCENHIRIEEQEFIASNERTIYMWMGSPSLYPTDCMKIQREQSPKSIAVPPTAHTGGGMWLCGVSIKCLCLYKWRHRGDFSISSYSPRYRLQRGKKGAFFNTFHNNKF